MATKRPADDDTTSDSPKKAKRQVCFFGTKCYRRNPLHFQEFQHPHLESIKSPGPDNAGVLQDQWKIIKDLGLLADDEDLIKQPPPGEKAEVHVEEKAADTKANHVVVKEKAGETKAKLHPILVKLEQAQPYSLFFTKVKDVPSTHNDRNSIFITDLLHSCHGNLRSTVQINFLVDYEWLKMAYEATGNEVRGNIASWLLSMAQHIILFLS